MEIIKYKYKSKYFLNNTSHGKTVNDEINNFLENSLNNFSYFEVINITFDSSVETLRAFLLYKYLD